MPQIVVENLCKTFKISERQAGLWGAVRGLAQRTYRHVEALKNVSFTLEEGELVGYIGPNGAGKSTTIGIISSLVNKTSGTTKVFGYDIDTDLELAKQNLGLVPQEFNFNQFETVEQIVMQQAGYYGVSKVLAKERAEKYLKKLVLWLIL